MTTIAIHGFFHVKGRSPDGDSIAFSAVREKHWAKFNWKNKSNNPANKKKGKAVQLRIEAVDALETHFNGNHQPRAIAQAATDALLKSFGIRTISYNLNFTKIVDATDGVAGTILTKGLDGYDRPISYAVVGHVEKDGEEFDGLDEKMLRTTVNFGLARQGVVYPAYYRGIDETALEVFRKEFAAARRGRVGIFAFDQTREFTWWGPHTLSDTAVIYPKVFRRFVSFAEARADWGEIAEYLGKQNDALTLVQSGEFTSLANLCRIEGRGVKLDLDPNDAVWGPKAKPTPVG
jgi:hypothetical protein